MENSKITILAIDDNKDNLITLNALVKEAFPNVKMLTALTGEAGLEIAEKEDPDVILLDIVMPRMDGFEICSRLKADKELSIIPVVFITAIKGDKTSRIRALEIGAEAFIAKPIDETELTAQIRAMLKIKKAAVEKRDEKERLSAMVEKKTNELNVIHNVTLNLLKELGNENEARKKSEEALRKSEADLKKAQHYSHVGSWNWIIPENRLNCSEEMLRIFGVTKSYEGSLEKFISKTVHPDDRLRVENAFLAGINNNKLTSLEYRLVLPDNSIRLVWTEVGEIELDEDLKPFMLKGIVQDITERRKAEEELKQSYQFNESLLKTIPFGMDIVDETGTVMFQNDNFKKLFGHEAIGKKCWEIYRNDKTQCIRCPLIKGISIGHTAAYESHDILDHRIFEIIHSGMIYQGKKAILEIFLDMTDKKLAEEELIRARDKAEESDRLKTAFLHNISHEIRTPMNAIVGFSSLIMDYKNDEKSLHEFLELIVKSSNHLLSIISDIVDIANIEANLVKVVKTKINCNSSIKLLFDQFLPVASKKDIQFLYETKISEKNSEIYTDSTKLSQILANLVSNAIKFTDKGYVKISCTRIENFIEYVVEDTGLGIPSEFHEKIFDRFYQVERSASRTYEGTGLGLAISRAHAELLGGNLRLSSEPGKGTSFYLTIPDENLENSENQRHEQVHQTLAFPANKTILVAEDTDSNFLLIKYFLSETNITLLRAKNGEEAVEIFKASNGIDMILMDIKMPVMDGYSAIKHIRETNTATPIIVQSAFAGDETQAYENGGSGFISKPFDKKSLLKVLREFM